MVKNVKKVSFLAMVQPRCVHRTFENITRASPLTALCIGIIPLLVRKSAAVTVKFCLDKLSLIPLLSQLQFITKSSDSVADTDDVRHTSKSLNCYLFARSQSKRLRSFRLLLQQVSVTDSSLLEFRKTASEL